jgi:hypothetical protein
MGSSEPRPGTQDDLDELIRQFAAGGYAAQGTEVANGDTCEPPGHGHAHGHGLVEACASSNIVATQ